MIWYSWKLRITGLCAGSSPVTGEFPHKWPVTRKMFPFDDVIMNTDDRKQAMDKQNIRSFLWDVIPHPCA